MAQPRKIPGGKRTKRTAKGNGGAAKAAVRLGKGGAVPGLDKVHLRPERLSAALDRIVKDETFRGRLEEMGIEFSSDVRKRIAGRKLSEISPVVAQARGTHPMIMVMVESTPLVIAVTVVL
jgi:hypothetical protein